MIQELRLYNPKPSQKAVFDSKARFLVMDCGRRWGKSLTALNWLLKSAWEQGGENFWVVPIYKIGAIAWRKLEAGVPRGAIKRISQVEMRMELISGGAIEIRSADNPENLRGEGIMNLVVDEAARVSREAWEEHCGPRFLIRGAERFLSARQRAGIGFLIFGPRARTGCKTLISHGNTRPRIILKSRKAISSRPGNPFRLTFSGKSTRRNFWRIAPASSET